MTIKVSDLVHPKVFAVYSVAIFWFGVPLVYLFMGMQADQTISAFSAQDATRFTYYKIINVLSWLAWLIYVFKHFIPKYKTARITIITLFVLLAFQIATVFSSALTQTAFHDLAAKGMFYAMFIVSLLFSRIPQFGRKSLLSGSGIVLSALFWSGFGQFSFLGQLLLLASFHSNWLHEKRSQ